MTQRGLGRLHSLALILLVLVGIDVAIADQHATQIAYWRERFPELKPADDARAATAHAIFERLVQVAGKRPGVVPRLFITARDPWEMTLPIAIRDGWIILSAGVLNICYQEPTRGKDRLAFVLAHELAHQLKDDLWHMRFFDAYQAAQTQTAVAPAYSACE
jgi:Zn-dependent protease with chaperone function